MSDQDSHGHPPVIVEGTAIADAPPPPLVVGELDAEGGAPTNHDGRDERSSDGADAVEAAAFPEADERFYLPSKSNPISRAAHRIFRALGKLCCLFIHAGSVTEVVVTGRGRCELRVVTPYAFCSRVELIGELWRDGVDNKGRRIARPSRCSKNDAEALLSTRAAEQLLPEISVISSTPVLTVDVNGNPRVLGPGYNHALHGVYVSADREPVEPSLEVASAALLRLLRDFFFATKSDKTRAMAALLTPALVYGCLLGEERVPMFVIEANRSQAGKGYLAGLIAAVYGERPNNVVPRVGGVGSFDEDFSAALLKGCPFIMLDNLKGFLDSSHIESFMTAFGPFNARTFRRAPAPIDRTRYILFATSNGFETTEDLENRSLRIKLWKRRQDYRFRSFKGMDALTYIRAHQSFYIGCVFRIVREWITAGRPGTEETRHSFRPWAQALDWILLKGFGDTLPGRMMDFEEIRENDAAAIAEEYELPDDSDDPDQF